MSINIPQLRADLEALKAAEERCGTRALDSQARYPGTAASMEPTLERVELTVSAIGVVLDLLNLMESAKRYGRARDR